MTASDNGTNGTIPFRELIDQQLDRLKEDVASRTDVLREVYNERIANIAERVTNLQNLVDQHFDAQEKAVEKALAVQERSLTIALAEVQKQNDLHAAAHAREHTAQNVAIDKSEKRNDERFEEGNGFRKQIESERATYARIDMIGLTERNTRADIERVEADIRLRMEKMEADNRVNMEKIERDLRQRIEAEASSRMLATSPLWTWQSNMTGRLAVAGVAGTILITAVVFLANYLTAR